MVHNNYRNGFVYVMREKCSTCIYRPGNLMDLDQGTREQMEEQSVAEGGPITCHKTLGTNRNAVCRGFFDVKKKEVPALQIAVWEGLIQEQEEEVRA